MGWGFGKKRGWEGFLRAASVPGSFVMGRSPEQIERSAYEGGLKQVGREHGGRAVFELATAPLIAAKGPVLGAKALGRAAPWAARAAPKVGASAPKLGGTQSVRSAVKNTPFFSRPAGDRMKGVLAGKIRGGQIGQTVTGRTLAPFRSSMTLGGLAGVGGLGLRALGGSRSSASPGAPPLGPGYTPPGGGGGQDAWEAALGGANQYAPAYNEMDAMANAAYNKALGNIEDKFRRAHEEIGRREATGQQLLGQLPGRISTQFGEGKQGLSEFAGAVGGAAQGMPASFESLGMNLADSYAPFTDAMTSMESSRQADVPLIQAGHGQYLGGQRTALDMLKSEEIQQAEMARQEALSRIAMARLEQEARMQEAYMNYKLQSGLEDDEYAKQVEQQRSIYAANKFPSADRGAFLADHGSAKLKQFYNTPHRDLGGKTVRQFLFEQYAELGDHNAVKQMYGTRWPDAVSLFLYEISE